MYNYDIVDPSMPEATYPHNPNHKLSKGEGYAIHPSILGRKEWVSRWNSNEPRVGRQCNGNVCGKENLY